MKIRIQIALWASLFFFCGCEKEEMQQGTAVTGYALLNAEIGEVKQVNSSSRAKQDDAGTYTAFENNDILGLYADYSPEDYSEGETPEEGGPLRQNTEGMEAVVNLPFKLEGSKWQNDANPKLKWRHNGKSADIYAYFPWKSGDFATGGYTIYEKDKLEDVLVAERTTVENNNPAIFLTFRHRFALLRLKLGTGLEGASDDIAVVMNTGITADAKIDRGVVKLNRDEGGIKEFKPVATTPSYYYVIVPVEKIPDANPTDSLQVSGIRIGDDYSTFTSPIVPGMNTIYYLTVHKGEEGSVSITVNGIEQWSGERQQGSTREEGGLYWTSDISRLSAALNKITDQGREPDENDTELNVYGSWDSEKGCWVFPVMRNIDMTEATVRNYSIKNFCGILEGNGYTITGLDIIGAGFIGKMESESEVRNLTLKDISVTNTGDGGTGALVGEVAAGAKIHNCSVEGISAVSGGANTGGLVGKGSPVITRSSANVEVSGATNTGGLVGSLEAGGSINNSYAIGRVTATGDQVGGLAGTAEGEITDSHAACKVNGKNNVGGLVGSTTAAVTKCYVTGTVEGVENVGGLVGQTTMGVLQCTVDGSVTGNAKVGGLIGLHSVASGITKTISECSSRASVNGANAGGLIGEAAEAEGTVIKDCFATNTHILVGINNAGISYSYEVVGTADGEGGDAESKYYRIALDAIDADEITDIIAALNTPEAGDTPSRMLWVKGVVMIDGIAYVLPVLNSK